MIDFKAINSRTRPVRLPPVSCLAVLFVASGGFGAGRLAQEADGPQAAPADAAAAAAPVAPPAEESAATPISGPRDLLRRYGIDESHFERLIDGRPIDQSENETLLNILYRVCDFSVPGAELRLHGFRLADVERWARGEPKPAELVKQPEANRGQIFRLSGRVTSVEVRHPLPEVAKRFELRQYYRCGFIFGEQGQPAVIFTRNIPRQWQAGGAIDQRAAAFGLFLKLAGTEPGRAKLDDPARPLPVFVAPRVAWHPETLLGDLGMDVGLLDEVKNKRPLSGHDRECFYQMLAAAGRAKPHQLLREARKLLKQSGEEEFSVEPLFNRPETQHGRLVALSGTARRVVRVRVGDPDIVARFGIDHYYNVFVFTDDSQGNPVVFCVRRLPEGMPTGDGPEYAEQVRLAGFFMKSWAYPVAFPGEASQPRSGRGVRRQLAPLLIGTEPVWYPYEPPAANTVAGAIAGGLFVLALLGIWLGLWQYARGDKRFRERTIAKTLSGDAGISPDEIAINVHGLPGSREADQPNGAGRP